MTLERPTAVTRATWEEREALLTRGAALWVRVNVNWRVRNTGDMLSTAPAHCN